MHRPALLGAALLTLAATAAQAHTGIGAANGFAYGLAALAVFFRDVLHILGILLTLWYFLTPIIFPIAAHPNESFLLQLNPMTPIIVAYQRTILDGVDPEWSWLAYSAAVAVGVFAIGFAFYRRASDSFEEEL